MDTELRVIRLDSFSKTLGMGFRVGYVIAPKPVTEKLALYQEISSFPSTLVSVGILVFIEVFISSPDSRESGSD